MAAPTYYGAGWLALPAKKHEPLSLGGGSRGDGVYARGRAARGVLAASVRVVLPFNQ